MADLRNIIRQLAQPDGEAIPLVCVVDSVDKDTRTIDCTPLNEGAPLLGVNLQANQGSKFGVCFFPAVGSFVVVGFVADGSAGVVLGTDEIDSAEIIIGNYSAVIDRDGCRFDAGNISAHITTDAVVFNGGEFGGLPVVGDLAKRLNIIEKDINTLKTVFASWVPVAQDGGAALSTAATSWAASQLSLTKAADYENTKVKH